MATEKKRDLQPLLQAAILHLVNLSADTHKLEYYDNDEASRRLKRELVDFEHGPLKKFKDAVKGIRESINKSKIKKHKTNGTEQTIPGNEHTDF